MKLIQITLAIIFTTHLLFAQNFSKGIKEEGKGCVAGDCNNGYGTYIYKDGSKYKGQFKEGLAHGDGTCTYSNGDYYYGEWKKHSYDGKGVLFFSSGEKYEGIWKAGELIKEQVVEQQIIDRHKRYQISTAKGTRHSNYVIPKSPSRVWALIIGAANYQNFNSLKYTDDDAYKLYVFLKSPEGGALPDENIKILVDEAATNFAIQENLEKIVEKADTNDMILFYFAGHGIKGAFLPTDYNPIANNQIYHAQMLNMLANSRAKHKVVIADICHAGSMRQEFQNTRGDIGKTANAYYKALEQTKGGTALILASGSEEVSVENQGIRQGVFSYFMIEGLKGKADTNADNLVTIQEMFDFTKSNVSFYTANKQNPMLIGDYDQNLPLGVIRHY